MWFSVIVVLNSVGEYHPKYYINNLSQFIYFYRYMNGAATNPDAHVFACAAAQVKKGLEIAHKLGAENFGLAYLCNVLCCYLKLTDLLADSSSNG